MIAKNISLKHHIKHYIRYTLITGILFENGDPILMLLGQVFHSQMKIKCVMVLTKNSIAIPGHFFIIVKLSMECVGMEKPIRAHADMFVFLLQMQTHHLLYLCHKGQHCMIRETITLSLIGAFPISVVIQNTVISGLWREYMYRRPHTATQLKKFMNLHESS